MIAAFIKGQSIQISESLIVAESLNYLKAQFLFITSDWNGIEKTAYFTQGKTTHPIKLDENNIAFPIHLSAGEWEVSVVGREYANGELAERITTDTATINVKPFKTGAETPFPEPTSTEIEALKAEIGKLPDLLTKDKTSIVNAINELYRKGGTGGGNGVDGFSPIVDIEEIDGGHRVTITDAEGIKEFEVLDGKDGDLYTLTEADKEQIKDAVLDEIPEVDLSGYAKTEDIPTKTSELINDRGFITKSDIPTSGKSAFDVFVDNATVDYAYDETTDAYYTIVRIYKNKLDGTKQYPFVYAPNGAESGTMSTYDLVMSSDWFFAINAGIFDTSTKPDGILIQNREVLQNTQSMTHPKCKPLTIDKNGTLGYAEYNVDAETLVSDGVVSAVCGFMPIIVDYLPTSNDSWNDVDHYNSNAQRQIIGQWGNGDYAIISCEGREYHNSDGWTIAEAQNICMKHGLKFAYNLDGGGSTETMLGKKHINTIYDGTTGRKVPTFIVFNGTTNLLKTVTENVSLEIIKGQTSCTDVRVSCGFEESHLITATNKRLLIPTFAPSTLTVNVPSSYNWAVSVYETPELTEEQVTTNGTTGNPIINNITRVIDTGWKTTSEDIEVQNGNMFALNIRRKDGVKMTDEDIVTLNANVSVTITHY